MLGKLTEASSPSALPSRLPAYPLTGYLCRRLRPANRPLGAILELPSEHRIPLTWLLENAGASIRYRTYRELAPEGYAPPETVEAAHLAISESKPALAVVKKQ